MSVPEQDRLLYVDFAARIIQRLNGLQEDVIVAGGDEGRPTLEDLFTEDELAQVPWPIEALGVARYGLRPTGVCQECNAYSPNGQYGKVDDHPAYEHLRQEILAPIHEASTTICPSCRTELYDNDGKIVRTKATTLRSFPSRMMSLLLDMPQEEREAFMRMDDDQRDDYLSARMYHELH
ncbi:TPA: hypothetical protein HA265_02770 [Candidatus Woesearchaeota archaeon]|nr:hypothetical protein [Candidatus Woesearchaeota archaeon]